MVGHSASVVELLGGEGKIPQHVGIVDQDLGF